MNRRHPAAAPAALPGLAAAVTIAVAATTGAAGSGCADGGPTPRAGAPVVIVDQPSPVVAAAGVAPPVTLEDPAGALAPLYRALGAAERGDDGARVAIVQFGDSHTAGDRLTGELRAVLQQRFGDAGRGFLLTGRPKIRHYDIVDARYGTDGAWTSDQGGRHGTEEPYGLGGVRSYAKKKSAVAWVGTCADCPTGQAVSRFEIFLWRQPGGGTLEARVDDGPWTRISTALAGDQGDVAIPDYEVIEVPDGDHRLSLRPRGDKEVDVFGVALERARPGVVVDGLGIVGLQMSHLWRWDWTVIGPQLAHRAPALVVLQYGTNEVDDSDLDLDTFVARYTELIGRIRSAAPDAAILMLGPPDMATRLLGRRCDKPAKKQTKSRHGRRKAPPPAPVGPAAEPPEGCRWKTPTQLLDIIDAERRVARATGVAFFDSFAAMGGADLIDGWVHAEPALAYKDHVHFTTRGYTWWADLLLEDLMRGYAAWQKESAAARR
ncbi:MAG: hypothetical protein H6709_23495 [Kofleriaceae bacterium]|nr:hypothetical protein [Kofleriaceae bacterium]